MTKDEALDLAQYALKKARSRIVEAGGSGWKLEAQQCVNAITVIKQARSAPVQEPLPPDDESICEDWISASDSDGVAYDGPSFERGYKLGQIAERDAVRPRPEIRGVRSEFEAMFTTPPAQIAPKEGTTP